MPVTTKIEEVRNEIEELAKTAPTAQALMQRRNSCAASNPAPAETTALIRSGAAASSGQTVVVDDVSKDSRYLACSLETRSEIVVPVFARGKVVGELDIDSHFPAAFTREHQHLVQYCAILVGKKLEAASA